MQQKTEEDVPGGKQVVLDENVVRILVDLRQERLFQVIGTDKNNNQHAYILKVTGKQGLVLS